MNIYTEGNNTLLQILKKLMFLYYLERKFLGFGNVFIGPSFQYVLNSDFGLSDIKEVSLDKFSLVCNLVLELNLGNLGIDVRWERGFSNTEARFCRYTTSIEFDNRVIKLFRIVLQILKNN